MFISNCWHRKYFIRRYRRSPLTCLLVLHLEKKNILAVTSSSIYDNMWPFNITQSTCTCLFESYFHQCHNRAKQSMFLYRQLFKLTLICLEHIKSALNLCFLFRVTKPAFIFIVNGSFITFYNYGNNCRGILVDCFCYVDGTVMCCWKWGTYRFHLEQYCLEILAFLLYTTHRSLISYVMRMFTFGVSK